MITKSRAPQPKEPLVLGSGFPTFPHEWLNHAESTLDWSIYFSRTAVAKQGPGVCFMLKSRAEALGLMDPLVNF